MAPPELDELRRQLDEFFDASSFVLQCFRLVQQCSFRRSMIDPKAMHRLPGTQQADNAKQFPISLIDDLFNQFSNASYFSKL